MCVSGQFAKYKQNMHYRAANTTQRTQLTEYVALKDARGFSLRGSMEDQGGGEGFSDPPHSQEKKPQVEENAGGRKTLQASFHL